MPSPDPLIAKAYAKALSDDRIVEDLERIGARFTYHNPTYRKALVEEMSRRFLDRNNKLAAVKAALQQYEDALTARKNGNVAAGALIDTIRPLLLPRT